MLIQRLGSRRSVSPSPELSALLDKVRLSLLHKEIIHLTVILHARFQFIFVTHLPDYIIFNGGRFMRIYRCNANGHLHCVVKNVLWTICCCNKHLFLMMLLNTMTAQKSAVIEGWVITWLGILLNHHFLVTFQKCITYVATNTTSDVRMSSQRQSSYSPMWSEELCLESLLIMSTRRSSRKCRDFSPQKWLARLDVTDVIEHLDGCVLSCGLRCVQVQLMRLKLTDCVEADFVASHLRMHRCKWQIDSGSVGTSWKIVT